jgi:copper chaperone CopZ
VEEKIKKINGIRKIEVNFITNVVMVEFDSTLLNKQEIEMNSDKATCKIMKLFL